MANQNLLTPEEREEEKRLRLGYWYVTHKIQLRKWLTISLIVICSGLGLFTIGMAVKLYLIEYSSYRQAMRQLSENLVNPEAVTAAGAEPLLQKQVVVLEDGPGRVDAYTEISNPNKDFWATWTGVFTAERTTTTRRIEYILPGEIKGITDLGIESPTRMRGARYEMMDIKWHRVNPHVIADYPKLEEERLDFEITDAEFSSAPSEDQKSSIARVSFKATNESAYSFWTAKFLVRLYRGTTLVAVNTVELTELETGETRNVEVVWVQDLKSISKTDIVPQVNILSASSYMPPRAR